MMTTDRNFEPSAGALTAEDSVSVEKTTQMQLYRNNAFNQSTMSKTSMLKSMSLTQII